MTRNKIVIGGVVVALIVLMGYVATHNGGSKNIVKGIGEPAGFDNVSLTGGLKVGVAAGDTTIPANGDGSITASSSLTITGTSTSFGGVGQSTNHKAATQATTTVCSIQSPPATSTLQFGSFLLTQPTSTSVVVTMSRSNDAYSTTSSGAVILATSTIAANAQGYTNAAATTTQTASLGALAIQNLTFSPSTFLDVTLTGGTGPFSMSGVCGAEWYIIQ